VRERQVEQHHVLAQPEVLDPLDRRGHGVVVAVADHAALRGAGRAGGVDVRVEIVLADGGSGLVERAWVRLRESDSVGPQVVQVLQCQDVLQLERLDLGHLVVVLDECAHCLGVPKDVGGLAGGAVGVDRGRDPADEREREVEQRPLEPRPADDSEGVPLADAAEEQPVRELVDCARGFVPGDLPPLARLGLCQVGGARTVRRNGVAPELDDRSVLAFTHRSDFTEGIVPSSANFLHPSTIGRSAL
jgi:hypothetical protein